MKDSSGARQRRYAHWIGDDVPVVDYIGSALRRQCIERRSLAGMVCPAELGPDEPGQRLHPREQGAERQRDPDRDGGDPRQPRPYPPASSGLAPAIGSGSVGLRARGRRLRRRPVLP